MTDEREITREATVSGVHTVIGNRDVNSDDRVEILVTLEGVVAGVLLATCGMNSEIATKMLDMGLITGVRRRLASAGERLKKHAGDTGGGL